MNEIHINNIQFNNVRIKHIPGAACAPRAYSCTCVSYEEEDTWCCMRTQSLFMHMCVI